jgi:hypothetical protein
MYPKTGESNRLLAIRCPRQPSQQAGDLEHSPYLLRRAELQDQPPTPLSRATVRIDEHAQGRAVDELHLRQIKDNACGCDSV